MTRRTLVWTVLAVLFLGVNLGGAAMAAGEGEVAHAGVHAGLLLLGALVVGRLAARRIAR